MPKGTTTDASNPAGTGSWEGEMPLTQLLSVAEVCDFLGVSKDTWAKWRAKGTAPAVIRLPNGSLRISVKELDEWLMSRAE